MSRNQRKNGSPWATINIEKGYHKQAWINAKQNPVATMRWFADQNKPCVMKMIVSNTMTFSQTNRAYDQNSILPMLHKALPGLYRDDFLEAMQEEIKELDKHSTCVVVKWDQLSEGANNLLNTWSLKIKPSVIKFKASFCVRGDKHIKDLHHHENLTLATLWTRKRLLMAQSLNLGLHNNQDCFPNAFVQAT
jgi:hypothetical protein